MKTTKTFSIERDILESFFAETEKKSESPNRVLETLMESYITGSKIRQINLLRCAICGAEYSEKLNSCPGCAADEVDGYVRAQKDAEEKAKKDAEDTQKHEYKDGLERQIAQIDNARARLESPDGTVMDAEEKKTQITLLTKRRQELMDFLLNAG